MLNYQRATFQLSMTCDDLPKHPVQGVLAIIFTGIWQAGKGWQSRFDKGVVHGYGKAGLLRGYPWCSSIESILSGLNSWWMIIGGYLYDITRYIWGWLNRTKKMIPDWDPPCFPTILDPAAWCGLKNQPALFGTEHAEQVAVTWRVVVSHLRR